MPFRSHVHGSKGKQQQQQQQKLEVIAIEASGIICFKYNILISDFVVHFCIE